MITRECSALSTERVIGLHYAKALHLNSIGIFIKLLIGKILTSVNIYNIAHCSGIIHFYRTCIKQIYADIEKVPHPSCSCTF